MNKNSWWSVAYRLRDYIRPERMIVIGALIALLLSTAMRLLKPLPLAFVVDHVLLDGVKVSTDDASLSRDRKSVV